MTVARTFDAVIVGTGHGGATAAATLRQQGFSGSIAMLTRENQSPYERPPLSKQYLAGERVLEQMLIRPASFWIDRNIIVLTNHIVVKVFPEEKSLALEDGSEIRYEHLIWAAGGNARKLSCSGADLKGVHTLRTLGDVDTLKTELAAAARVVVVGGGFIGLEAAAVFSKFGKNVTVLESLDRVLARVAAEPLSRFFENQHKAHGVDVRLQAQVERLEGNDSRVVAVLLQDGTRIPADIVIVGVGIVPAIEPFIGTGADLSNGISVDEFCRTSLSGIYAVGDCALHKNPYAGGREVRVESVQNAHDQAQVAAKSVCGKPTPYNTVPWFWSNQFEVKLQTIGLSVGFEKAVVRGLPETCRFSVVYLRDGRVIAVDCVNSPKDYMQGRALIVGNALVDANRLANIELPLKDAVSVSSELAP